MHGHGPCIQDEKSAEDLAICTYSEVGEKDASKEANLGLSEDDARKIAYSRKGCWHTALCDQMHRALDNNRLQRAGFVYFSACYRSVHVA